MEFQQRNSGNPKFKASTYPGDELFKSSIELVRLNQRKSFNLTKEGKTPEAETGKAIGTLTSISCGRR